jgi:hypothetical protein
LSACSDSSCHKSLEHQGFEISSGEIDGCCMTSWAGAYDDYIFHNERKMTIKKFDWLTYRVSDIFCKKNMFCLEIENHEEINKQQLLYQ